MQEHIELTRHKNCREKKKSFSSRTDKYYILYTQVCLHQVFMILWMKLPIKQLSRKNVCISRIVQSLWHHSVMNERKKVLLTLRVLSTSPQGNLFTKSIPVSGVPVGGNKIEASIIKYSTFMGLIYKNILTLITIENN